MVGVNNSYAKIRGKAQQKFAFIGVFLFYAN